MNDLGLTASQKCLLIALFHQYPAIEQVKVYGSRAKGCHHSRSDVDLVVYGHSLDRFVIAKLLLDIQSSDLPYMVDLQNYHDIKNQALRNHIDRLGVVLYQRPEHAPIVAVNA
jgi:predicted nucleotidyltransferase